MKKLIILAALALAACDANNYLPDKEGDTAKWTDPETGCVYLLYHDGFGQSSVGSLSIRFTEQGLPDCPGTRAVTLIPPVDPTEEPVAP